MSKKIKEIKIEAFRAYEKLMQFNFQHKKTGKIADLVVIYAPNGYGKTSFFDAIEWAVTGEIGRFKSTNAIKQEIKNISGDILKNKSSKKSQGIVQIISENNKSFERKTKKLKGRMKNDYKAGDYEVIPKELRGLLKEKDTFCTTNLLAHDKITSFLQYYTAEDKSKMLQVFWDTKGYSKILKKVNDIYNEIEKKAISLSKEIKSENRELNKFNYELDKEHIICKAIDEFNMNNIEYKIDSKNLIENIDSVFIFTTKLLDNILKKKKFQEDKINTLELLEMEYHQFLSNRTELKNKQIIKVECEKKIKTLNDVDGLLKQNNKLIIERQELNNVIESWSLFEDITLKLIDKITLRKKSNDLKPVLQKNIIEVKENIKDIQDNIQKYSGIKKEKLRDIKTIEVDIENYNTNITHFKKYSRLLQKAQYILDKRLDRREVLSNQISYIESVADNISDIKEVKNCFTNEVFLLNEKINELKVYKSNQEVEINNLEKEYENEINLHNKMNKIVILGKELVENTMSCECPLCHAKYNNLKTLIERISKDEKDYKLKKIKNDLNIKKELLKQTNTNISTKSDKLKTRIKDTLSKFKEKFDRCNSKINRLKLDVNDWSNLINNIEELNLNIKKKYESIKVNIEDNNMINIYKNNINKAVIILSQRLEVEEKNIVAKQNDIKSIESKLKEGELKVIELDKQILTLQNHEKYKLIMQFLKNNKLNSKDIDLKSKLERIKEEYNEVSNDINSTKLKISDLKNTINGTKEEFEKKHTTLVIDIQELNTIVNGYILRCSKSLETEKINEKNINKQIQTQKIQALNIMNKLDNNINKLDVIISDMRNLKNHKLWLDKKKEFNKKEYKLDTIYMRKENLEKSKTFIENYIVKQTNSYFNSNIINQIYNKIDPHPTMNHIKFLTEKSKKGLQTHIYTYDKCETDKMSPVLYLSSAQVNILSLCIFLAKVLTESHTTLNTIFMDDPIQHLDGINLLAFIDLLRTITTVMGRQIIISTHNEHFYNLIRVKMDEKYYLSKFIELKSMGEVK